MDIIHRYSSLEKKGILVYGYNSEPSWNSPSPILFSKEQCITIVKTGCLVFFDVDDKNIVSNIQQASIFNFDKEFLQELVSFFDSKDWYECRKFTQIRYQNIYELEEFYEYEQPFYKTEKDVNSEETICNKSITSGDVDIDEIDVEDDEKLFDELDLEFDDIFDDDDEHFTSTGEYRKITGQRIFPVGGDDVKNIVFPV